MIWAPLYLAILIYIGITYKKKFLLILPFIILAVALADQVSVQVFKNVFQRLRPCHEPSLQGMVHLVNGECGGLYGFVSSHASNSFNVALISLMFIKKRWYTISIISGQQLSDTAGSIWAFITREMLSAVLCWEH